MSNSAYLYPLRGLSFFFWKENRARLWQQAVTFALQVGVAATAILGTLAKFTFETQRNMLVELLPEYLDHTLGTVALILMETAIPVILIFHHRHKSIQESLFDDVLHLQGIRVERVSPSESNWIAEQRSIQMQARSFEGQSIISLIPSIVMDPETLLNYPILKYVVTLPLNFIPIFGQLLFCWLNAMETATMLHHYYYHDLKGLSAEQVATMVHIKKSEYIQFGLMASALTLLPGLNLILVLTNAIGAALWAADIERDFQQHQ